jgi:hypothetical protein
VDVKGIPLKGYLRILGSLELFGAIYELRYLWDVEDGLIEKHEREVVKKRSIDSGHEVLRVLADTFEHESGEGRKDSAGRWRGTSIC